MMRMRTMAVAAGVALALSAGLVGCGGEQPASDTQAPQQQATQEAAAPETSSEQQGQVTSTRRVVGTDAAEALEVTLQNGTGATMEALSMRVQGTLDYGADLLAGTAIPAGGEVTLRVLPQEVTPAADVRMTLAGGEVVEVVGVPVVGVAHISLSMADGQGFADYVRADGTVASTRAAAPAPETSSAQETPAAPETSASESTQEMPAAEEPVQVEVVTYVEQVPTEAAPQEAPTEAPGAPSQTEDSCLDDGVMLKD